jgi:hypothetical protein
MLVIVFIMFVMNFFQWTWVMAILIEFRYMLVNIVHHEYERVNVGHI